jgi:hypothetical protein
MGASLLGYVFTGDLRNHRRNTCIVFYRGLDVLLVTLEIIKILCSSFSGSSTLGIILGCGVDFRGWCGVPMSVRLGILA